jgi:hypothetical protein
LLFFLPLEPPAPPVLAACAALFFPFPLLLVLLSCSAACVAAAVVDLDGSLVAVLLPLPLPLKLPLAEAVVTLFLGSRMLSLAVAMKSLSGRGPSILEIGTLFLSCPTY